MLREWLQRWKSRRRACAAAVRCFRETTGLWPIWSMTRIVATDDSGIVVRVCSWGSRKPPRRHWFRVKPDGSVVPMDWQEAQQLGEGPWR